jgi:hypothetical protein
MIKQFMTMFGLCVATAAGAVNDPDSIGRYVKYLDAINPLVISYHTVGAPCFQYAPSVPQPTSPITCVPLTGPTTNFQVLPITSAGDIAVAANASRSLLSLNLQPVADYNLNNANALRSALVLSAQVKVTIESSVLSDLNLINPRTGQPFDGKIESTYQWIFDNRVVEPSNSFAVASKMPFEVTVLSRKMLTTMYGISATRAALIFARPITVKVSTTGNLLGSGRANFFLNGRLLGD